MSYRVRFGAYDVDPQAGDLRKSGMRVRLGGQPMQILLMLLDRPGEVVSREELQQRIWPAASMEEFDARLSTAMRKLREALRDSADQPRFIETLPRRGFRFIAAVNTDQAAPPARRVDWRWIAAAIAAVAIAAIFVARYRPAMRSAAIVPFENITGDRSQKSRADGLTNRLAARLRLPVIPRTSKDVDMIVTGSVSRTGISVQLIRASSGEVIWARTYQSEEPIARDVGHALRNAP